MRTGLLGRPPLSAQSNSGHGYGYGYAAVSQGPRPASRVLLPVRSGTTVPRAFAGPRGARVAAPAPALRSSSTWSGSEAVLGGSRRLTPAAPPTSRRQVVQTAAAGSGAAAGGANSGGRGSGRGYRGSGTGRGGGSRGRGSPPADNQTLEELRAVVNGQLPGWVARKDNASIWRAFNKAAKLRSGDGGAATAARIRSGIIADLSAAYLPLGPAVCAAVECSIPLWAMAKVGISGQGKEAQLAAALLERLVGPAVLSTATPMDLSLALYALGKLREDWQQNGEGWDQSLGKLADAIKTRLTAAVGHGFNAQDVSHALWACAKLGLADADLLQRLADAGAAAAGNMAPQALSNSLWALEALGCTGPAYRSAVQVLCGEAFRRLRTPELAAAFAPQHLSNILLALEGLQLGREKAQLVAAVAADGVRRGFAGFKPQELSNSAWALAKMGFGAGPEAPEEQRQWVSAAVDAAMRPGTMATATPQAWANLLYALALMRHQPPPALLQNAGAAAAMLSSGSGQNCANTLYALAVLQLRHAGLEAAVCGRLRELLRGDRQALNNQEVSNTLWAMAVLGGTSSPGMQQLAIQLARNAAGRWEGLIHEDLSQLWQAQQELGGEVAETLCGISSLQAAMDKSVETYRQDTKRLSETHKQLLAALRRLEQHQGREAAGGFAVVSVQAGVVAPGVLAAVDAVVRLNDGRQAAVEFAGAVSFLANLRQRDTAAVNGGAAMRHRQLRRAFGEGGVLLVPYWEWDRLQTTEEQEAYLLRRLQKVVVMAAEPQAAEAATTGAGRAAAGAPVRTTGATASVVSPSSNNSNSSRGSPGGGGPGRSRPLARPPRRV